jgi:hypothetical protein
LLTADPRASRSTEPTLEGFEGIFQVVDGGEGRDTAGTRLDVGPTAAQTRARSTDARGLMIPAVLQNDRVRVALS